MLKLMFRADAVQSQCLAIWDSLFAVPWVTTAHCHVLVHVSWLAVCTLPSLSITVMSKNDTVWGPVSYELDGGVGLVEMLHKVFQVVFSMVHMVKTSYRHQICGFFSVSARIWLSSLPMKMLA